MATLEHQPTTDPIIVWHPISTVPGEHLSAWVRWHDNSQGITALTAGRNADWWGHQGATHWRLITEVEAAAYNDLGR